MSEYYDRQGNPLTLMEWATRTEKRLDKVVEQTTLPDGKWVSTVWLGINHRFGDGPPLIFETMVFPSKVSELDCERYSTEAQARAGHAAMVAKYGG